MLKNLSPENESRPRRSMPKLVVAAALLLTLAITASAYTLVLRNGQRIEIPSEFTLTRTTLTYELSPGFNKTMLLVLIDVAGTERANQEAPGSFFKRREQAPVVTEPTPRAIRTLTNSDLVAIRQRRIESEKNYEARRRELGLPTVAETRRRQDAEGAVLYQQLREQSRGRAREESYWRQRARELRTEIASVDSQINYLQGRLSEMRETSPVTGSWTSTYPIWPDYRSWPGNGRSRSRRRQRQDPPIFGRSPQSPYGYPPGQSPYGYPSPQSPYGYPPGQYPYGYPTGQYPYGYPTGQYPNGYPTGQYPYGYPPGQYPYGYPTGQYPYGYPTGPSDDFEKSAQQTDLTHRLDDLLIRRTGLISQWRALEDEARDARVPQIWLEP